MIQRIGFLHIVCCDGIRNRTIPIIRPTWIFRCIKLCRSRISLFIRISWKCIRHDNLFHESISLMPSSFMVKVCTEFEKNIFRIIDIAICIRCSAVLSSAIIGIVIISWKLQHIHIQCFHTESCVSCRFFNHCTVFIFPRNISTDFIPFRRQSFFEVHCIRERYRSS